MEPKATKNFNSFYGGRKGADKQFRWWGLIRLMKCRDFSLKHSKWVLAKNHTQNSDFTLDAIAMSSSLIFELFYGWLITVERISCVVLRRIQKFLFTCLCSFLQNSVISPVMLCHTKLCVYATPQTSNLFQLISMTQHKTALQHVTSSRAQFIWIKLNCFHYSRLNER